MTWELFIGCLLYTSYQGVQNFEETVELIKKNSRNYAKRQYTWFNNQMPVKWFDVNLDNFNNTVEEVIEYLKYDEFL